MRIIRYGFFGEDAAQRELLAAYLGCYSASEVYFEPVAYFGKQFGPMNNKVVDRRCGDACLEAFVLGYPLLDWLFIGRDVDSFEFEHHEKRAQELRKNIPAQWHSRTLLMLPVQCAEHWLLYLQKYPGREPLERIPNHQVKELVYADHNQLRLATRNILLSQLDFERIAWLAEVSASFRAFHQQFTQYLKAAPEEA